MAFRDVVMIAVLLFFFAFAFFIGNYVLNTSIDSMLNVSEINGTQGTVDSLEAGKAVLSRLDGILFTVFMGLVLSLIITGWFVGGYPIFMAIYVIGIVLTVVISTILSNFWETTTGMTVFGNTLAAFPITNHLMLYLPYYMSVVGFIGLVVMFAKPRE